MTSRILALLACLLLAAAAWGDTLHVGPGETYTTIQAAINAAAPGDVVQVADGTYVEALDIAKALTLRGTTEAGTIIDASSFNDYGIDANGDFATAFEDFTLYGPAANENHAYGLKISGDDATTVVRRVTLTGAHKSGLDLNGLAGAVIEDVTATRNGANGVAMTDCSDVTLTDVTTSGNAWGGVAIYTGGGWFTAGSDNITFAVAQNLGELAAVYVEIDDGVPVTNLNLPTALCPVYGKNTALPNHTFYPTSVTNAVTMALAAPATSTIVDRANGNWVVGPGMYLQLAIDTAAPGDTVFLLAGDHTPAATSYADVRINKNLTLAGAGKNSTYLRLRYDITDGIYIWNAAAIILRDLTITKLDGESYASDFMVRVDGANTDFQMIDTEVSYANGRCVHLQSGVFTNVVVDDCDIHHSGAWGFSTGATVQQMTITSSLFNDNGSVDPAHGIGFDLAGGSSNNVHVQGDCEFSRNAAKGINISLTHGALFEQFEAVGNGLNGVCLWEWVGASNDLTFRDFRIANTGTTGNADGMLFGSEGTCLVSGILIENGTFANNHRFNIAFWNAGTGDITGAEVHRCDLSDNGVGGSMLSNLALVNATCNWWGDLSGPTGNDLTGVFTYLPFLDGPDGACDEYGPDHVAAVPPAGCVAPAATQVIDVVYTRADATPLRAVSVDVQLPQELVLHGATPIVRGSIWNGFGDDDADDGFALQVTDRADGLYTVDLAILGDDCGPTTGGVLFTMAVALASGVTTTADVPIAVTAVSARSCANPPAVLPGNPGAPALVHVDAVAPATVAGLAATQVKTGNDADGTTKIDLAWTAPEGDAAQVEIWRKGFGAYPEYDDAGGDAPTAVDDTWILVATQPAGAPAITDEPPTRDFWYYAAVVIDECGNRSLPSAITGGTLNYHLGDVIVNNLVNTGDVSRLGGNYGLAVTPEINDLDVGPTTNWGTDGRPLTDNQIQFEDLLIFAMNYGEVAKESLPVLTPAATSAVVAKVNEAEGDAFTVEVAMSGDGRVQGLSVPLTWNAQAVRPVGFAAGDLVAAQGGLGLVLSPQPGVIDAALFGPRDQGICGTGTLATVTFAVIGAGEFEIGLGEVTARDGRNEAVAVGGQLSEPVSVVPARTELFANAPNPFNPSTELSFALARAGAATLRIYTVQGRLVATLVDGELTAGRHVATWHGRDDAGRLVGSGAYIVRLETADGAQSRRITLMK